MKRMWKRAVLFLVGASGFCATSNAMASGTCQVIASNYSGQCMAVAGGNMTLGAPIIQWDCIGTPDQYWAMDVTNDSAYHIRNCSEPNGIAYCLSVPENSVGVPNNAEGVQLVLDVCNESTLSNIWSLETINQQNNQAWELTSTENVFVVAVSLGAGTGTPPGTNQGTGIIQWQDQTGPYTHYEQQWVVLGGP